MREGNLTWKEVVKRALLEVGGEGHLSELNAKIEGHPKTTNNPTWQATIRRVVREYKIFRPLGGGVYRLVDEVTPETGPEKFTEEEETDHGIAQGMLVVLGKIYGYETYVSARDQGSRIFQGNPLSEYISVAQCPGVATNPNNQRKIKEIDVLWFGEDDEGLYPVYAFEVEVTTGVKDGLDRLLKIPERLNTDFFIIGPSERARELFQRYTNQMPYRPFKERFAFRFFGELEGLYNSAAEHEKKRAAFDIFIR